MRFRVIYQGRQWLGPKANYLSNQERYVIETEAQAGSEKISSVRLTWMFFLTYHMIKMFPRISMWLITLLNSYNINTNPLSYI